MTICAMFSFASLGTRDFVACNHLRSYKYYAESILNPHGFTAYPCTSYKDFESVSSHPALDQGHSHTVGLWSSGVWNSCVMCWLPLRVYDPMEGKRKILRSSRYRVAKILSLLGNKTRKLNRAIGTWSRKVSCRGQRLDVAWEMIAYKEGAHMSCLTCVRQNMHVRTCGRRIHTSTKRESGWGAVPE